MVQWHGRHLSWQPLLLTTTPHQGEDVSALDRFSVHRCSTRWVFSGTALELVTKPDTIRYLYHSATAARNVLLWCGLLTETKLRSPTPIALVLLYSTTVINTHSQWRTQGVPGVRTPKALDFFPIDYNSKYIVRKI
ncbi:uncharacterized protein TNCV_3758641 [Trichonephila clavipes]|nr:uncharacterized protein TNCV_3758641 [Trichonephila clavipes]